MSARLALGAAGALAGLVALSRRGSRSSSEVDRVGSLLRGALAAPEAYEILDRGMDGVTWMEGGCGVLAQALIEVFGPAAQLYAIYSSSQPGVPQHFVVHFGGVFLDGDGASTRGTLLRRFRRYYGGRGRQNLRPVRDVATAMRAGQVSCPAHTVRELAAYLRPILRDTPGSRSTLETVPQLEERLRSQYGVTLHLNGPRWGDAHEPHIVTLDSIVVPASLRSRGTGSAVMRQLTAWADAAGHILSLTPAGDFGGSVPRLRRFYRRFGFVPNRGRAKDFRTRDAMIRHPRRGSSNEAQPWAPTRHLQVTIPDLGPAGKSVSQVDVTPAIPVVQQGLDLPLPCGVDVRQVVAEFSVEVSGHGFFMVRASDSSSETIRSPSPIGE